MGAVAAGIGLLPVRLLHFADGVCARLQIGKAIAAIAAGGLSPIHIVGAALQANGPSSQTAFVPIPNAIAVGVVEFASAHIERAPIAKAHLCVLDGGEGNLLAEGRRVGVAGVVCQLLHHPVLARIQVCEDNHPVGACCAAPELGPGAVLPDVEGELPAGQSRLHSFVPDLISVLVQVFAHRQHRILGVAKVGSPLGPRVGGASGAGLGEGCAVSPTVLQRFDKCIVTVAHNAVSEKGIAVGIGDGGELTGGCGQAETPTRQIRLILFLKAVEVTVFKFVGDDQIGRFFPTVGGCGLGLDRYILPKHQPLPTVRAGLVDKTRTSRQVDIGCGGNDRAARAVAGQGKAGLALSIGDGAGTVQTPTAGGDIDCITGQGRSSFGQTDGEGMGWLKGKKTGA